MLLATKPMSLYQRGPRSPHAVASARGRSGELQQLREDMEYAALMSAGWLDRPVIEYGSNPSFSTTTATTYSLYGRGFIPPGWEQARLTIEPAGDNNGIEWIAVEPGKDGNDLAIEYVNASSTSVSYADGVVTVAFNVSVGETANNIITALASSNAASVVMARNVFGSTGAGTITTTYPKTKLSGGRGSALRCAYLARGSASNSQLIWRARKPGVEGELISVTYRAGLGSGLLPVITVTGHDIDVYLREASTTANDILRALETNDDARALVDVYLAYGHNGTGLPGALAKANLANGSDGTAVRVEVGGAACTVKKITNREITFTVPALTAFSANTMVPAVVDVCGYVTTLQGLTA